jgi:hypothetical protein
MTLSLRFPVLILLALLVGIGEAAAQAVGPDEAVTPSGAVTQKLALTPVQRSAIYNAVIREKTRTSMPRMAVAIGASVPPAVALRDLPDQAAIDDQEAGLLKYAMVEDDVVVVDPIRMRVVDVIHRSIKQ